MLKLGERISKIRIKLALTQIDLAARCNIEPTNLIRIEKGRTNPTIKTMRRISNALDMTLSELLDFENN